MSRMSSTSRQVTRCQLWKCWRVATAGPSSCKWPPVWRWRASHMWQLWAAQRRPSGRRARQRLHASFSAGLGTIRFAQPACYNWTHMSRNACTSAVRLHTTLYDRVEQNCTPLENATCKQASHIRCTQALAEIAVEEERWDEALSLLRRHPDLAETVVLPRAEWLLAQDRPEEAYSAYK